MNCWRELLAAANKSANKWHPRRCELLARGIPLGFRRQQFSLCHPRTENRAANNYLLAAERQALSSASYRQKIGMKPNFKKQAGLPAARRATKRWLLTDIISCETYFAANP
jgi:hypothetical protein